MASVGTIIPTVTSLVANLDAKLPVAVSIIIHNANDKDAGLLNIDVWGYGNAPRAPLSRLSTFNLRIASSYQSINGGLQYGKLLRQDIDVEEDCKMWLDNCLEHHGQDCDEPSWWNELQPPSGPHFRLIDVYTMRIVQIDMANLRKQDRPKYAALSYVWGAAGSQALNLHVRNLESLSAQLEGQMPPIAKTIRDAIAVTGRLGLQYIWVDSLCIIQKDDRYEDDPDARKSQIEQMDSIFGHAAVTLVAADGLDAEAGLCGISTRPVRNQIARGIRPNVNVLLAVKYNDTYGKWDTRAWTLQEKLLSKRMLIFNGGYASYHCQHGVLREDMPGSHAGSGPPQISWVSSLPDDSGVSKIKRAWDGAPVLLRSPFFTEYAKLLAQYTGRDMTDSRDSLNAVMGLLKVLEKMANTNRPQGTLGGTNAQAPLGHTLYGLPEKYLDLALLWHPPAAKGVHLTKRAHDYLPSWSWAAWEIGKDPDYHPDTKKKYHTQPGVRFEEPFWVSTQDDLSLKKVIARKAGNKQPAEERFKPLVMWYRSLTPPLPQGTLRGSQSTADLGNGAAAEAPLALVPVNGHGLGLAFDPADEEELRRFKEDAIKLRTGSASDPPTDLAPPSVPTGIPIDNRHLVCETQVARFRLRVTKPRQEILWKPSAKRGKGLDVDTELIIHEAEILDSSDTVVGRVIPTDHQRSLSSSLYDFILLSESQYWGDEDRVDVSGLPLFNVMFVEWDTRGEFATRLGVGKVQKSAWWAAQPTTEVVIL
ncbi:heterokaryon incompatibility protein-domain-containing protein, partial [Bisporella sp. PMI_857]